MWTSDAITELQAAYACCCQLLEQDHLQNLCWDVEQCHLAWCIMASEALLICHAQVLWVCERNKLDKNMPS